jgi:hypothetical protein
LPEFPSDETRFCGIPCAVKGRKRRSVGSFACRERAGQWKGGRIVNQRGYVLICVGVGHPLATRNRPYALEHRVVMSNMIGRSLRRGEVVHHKDGNKQNNAPANLELWNSQGEHLRKSHSGSAWRKRKSPLPKTFCHCGRPVKARGLCDTHYAELRRRESGQSVLVIREACWCGQPHVARGLCDRHYSYAKRRGFSAEAMHAVSAPPENSIGV